MKYLINQQPLLGGKLTDYVIRYETQGRGSVHAHMLWWIDVDHRYIPAQDVIKLPMDVLKKFGLVHEKAELSSQQDGDIAEGGGENMENEDEVEEGDEADVEDETQWVKVYNEDYLNLTNANIWALKKKENIRKKLYIGIPPLETLTYVQSLIFETIDDQ